MKKHFALPALALAAMFVFDPSFAATKKKPAAAATTKPGPADSAQMKAGNRHKLHGISIRSADTADWATMRVVTLERGSSDAECAWDKAPTPLAELEGAKLFVVSDSTGTYWLHIMSGNDLYIVRQMDFDGVGSENTWLKSEPKNDWNFYVFFEDSASSPDPGQLIEKRYHVEIFPPEKKASDKCNLERPPTAVSVAASPAAAKSQPCQTGSGSGTEPKH
jgi:hypothetical protein